MYKIDLSLSQKERQHQSCNLKRGRQVSSEAEIAQQNGIDIRNIGTFLKII